MQGLNFLKDSYIWGFHHREMLISMKKYFTVYNMFCLRKTLYTDVEYYCSTEATNDKNFTPVTGVRAAKIATKRIDHFRYIKIQLDSEAQKTQTKEVNKHGHLISFVCVL